MPDANSPGAVEQCDEMGCFAEATVYTMCREHAPDSWLEMKDAE